MAAKGYLPLNDYSAKYRISLSTLRRRIRAGELEYRFEGGKYWLAEQPPKKYGHVMAEEQQQVVSLAQMAAVTPATVAPSGSSMQASSARTTDALLDSAKNMMQELKGAYVSVLHEKEKQITELKEEISDLKTLVKILEADNERLRMNPLCR